MIKSKTLRGQENVILICQCSSPVHIFSYEKWRAGSVFVNLKQSHTGKFEPVITSLKHICLNYWLLFFEQILVLADIKITSSSLCTKMKTTPTSFKFYFILLKRTTA